MKLHAMIANLCLMASLACLALVYGPSSYWPALIAVPAMFPLWILTKRALASWRPSAVLCVYLLLAAAGIMLRRPQLPLILGSTATLIWWDLKDFEEGHRAGILAKADRSLQKYRLQSLGFTAGASLLLVGIGFWLRIQLPFGVIALLILLIAGCLVYAAGILRNPPLSRE